MNSNPKQNLRKNEENTIWEKKLRTGIIKQLEETTTVFICIYKYIYIYKSPNL